MEVGQMSGLFSLLCTHLGFLFSCLLVLAQRQGFGGV